MGDDVYLRRNFIHMFFEGPRGFLLYLEGLRGYWNEVRIYDVYGDYIYVCLRGKVKSEHVIRGHLLPYVSVIGSGICIKDSVYRLLELKASQGFTDGPTASNTQGVVFSTER